MMPFLFVEQNCVMIFFVAQTGLMLIESHAQKNSSSEKQSDNSLEQEASVGTLSKSDVIQKGLCPCVSEENIF